MQSSPYMLRLFPFRARDDGDRKAQVRGTVKTDKWDAHLANNANWILASASVHQPQLELVLTI